MRVLRRYVTLSTNEERGTSYHIQVCDQPRLDVIKHELFHRVLEKIVYRPAQFLEPIARRLHERTCNDDCTNGWTTVGPDREPGEEVKMCGRTPLDCELDIKCFDLGEKNSKIIEDIELNESTYKALDPVLGWH